MLIDLTYRISNRLIFIFLEFYSLYFKLAWNFQIDVLNFFIFLFFYIFWRSKRSERHIYFLFLSSSTICSNIHSRIKLNFRFRMTDGIFSIIIVSIFRTGNIIQRGVIRIKRWCINRPLRCTSSFSVLTYRGYLFKNTEIGLHPTCLRLTA